ncbi:DUF423 domain-containing protein [Maribacter chungangensis]|uniref:DUF423 domain-containing protein n=1 Tax=Maribacter chungangensis TaxID=1069117 RepID=A0ABW3B8A0_9FLAO
MNKTIFVTASVLGLLAVLLGAFGAHGLQKIVDAKAVTSFETGVRYQMYHAFFLYVLGFLPGLSDRVKQSVFYLVIVGIVLFSFSIYLLAINGLFDFDFKVIAFITPIGGTLLITAWGVLGYSIYKGK